MSRKVVVLLMCLMLVFSSVTFAEDSKGLFKDLTQEHWAYSAILEMIQSGILSGYPEGDFRPNQDVTRGEFAKMMVLALDLPLDQNARTSFSDLKEGSWVVPYVEVAKQYLTGFKSGSDYKFKPDMAAVREDMAVALVKALNYPLSSEDKISDFADYEAISPNLRAYVATAYDKGIMQGSLDVSGKRHFNAQSAITRAEASVLLMNVIVEEKITFEDVKIPLDSDVSLYGSTANGKINLEWLVSDQVGLNGYKVVASLEDSTPSYPSNGYMAYLSSTKTQNIQFEAGDSNTNGDFGELEAGKTYYFTITALYDTGNITSNVIQLTMPGTASSSTDMTPVVEGNVLEDGSIQISWDKITATGFQGYKVVASKSNTTPSYPDDGYFKWITTASTTSTIIKAGNSYNSGDVGAFKAGSTYYFTVTAVYGDKKLTGNVIQLTLGGTPQAETSAVKLSYEIADGNLNLSWSSIDSEQFRGYKVVVSVSDSSPKYPDNGYYKYITNADESEAVLKNGYGYTNGDFETFKSDQYYYIAITTLYNDGTSKTSNVIKVKMP